jgi:hypothetical protein
VTTSIHQGETATGSVQPADIRLGRLSTMASLGHLKGIITEKNDWRSS